MTLGPPQAAEALAELNDPSRASQAASAEEEALVVQLMADVRERLRLLGADGMRGAEEGWLAGWMDGFEER